MSNHQFFLGRQPIVGRDLELVAYEFLFRNNQINAAAVFDDVSASATVIQHMFADLGLKAALGDKQGFINLPEALLMSDAIEMLPQERVVLEILETVQLTPGVLTRCQELREAGYMLALDDVVELGDAQKAVLPLVHMVKLDVLALGREEVADLVGTLRPYNITLLAEKVETLEQYHFCRDLGCDLFQGYFFAKPIILTGKSVQPSTMVLMKLLGLIAADVEVEELERALKHAPGVALRLLKMANSAAFGAVRTISSLRQAIVMLGRVRLNRLVQVMLFSQQNGTAATSDPLLQTAVVRGRLMEGLAGALGWAKLRDRAFMVGMLSLVDTLFHQPMTEVLGLLNLEDSVRDALLHRSGELGSLLALVTASENAEGGAAMALLQDFPQLDFEQFNRAQIEALKWANSI
jgi:c-di-GMP-related signal transduction protein